MIGVAGGSVPFGYLRVPREVSLQTVYWGSRSELREVLELASRGIFVPRPRRSRWTRRSTPTEHSSTENSWDGPWSLPPRRRELGGQSAPVDPEVKATVRHIDEVSRGWLSAALGARVRSVRAEPIGTGQTSATYRLAVDADICPSSLVIKFASGDDAACRRVATAHRSEVGFYQELSASLGVRTPSCWYGALDEDGCRFTLVVEDLAPWRPGRQIDGCTQTQAMAAVRYLAALHASRWNDGSLHDMAFLIRLTKERAEFLGDLALAATDAFIVRYGSRA